MNDNHKSKRHLPPVIEQCNPEPDLEEKAREKPDDLQTKVDVGSDESMDASDPISAVQPGHNKPAPSSGFPEDEEKKERDTAGR